MGRFKNILNAAFLSLFILVASGDHNAAADSSKETVPQLIASLKKAPDDAAKIKAVSELGRRKDARALPSLKSSLSDKNKLVRAVAAQALGTLSDPSAIDVLRIATKDKDKSVKRAAKKSIRAIEKALEQKNNPLAQTKATSHKAINKHAEYFVEVQSAIDDTPGNVKKRVRSERASALETIVKNELSNDQRVTLSEKQSNGLDYYALDVAIAKLQRESKGSHVEVSCDLRLAISNKRGKMLSILTGGAKVRVPKDKFRKQYEPQMQKEALENAVKNVHHDLSNYLRQNPI